MKEKKEVTLESLDEKLETVTAVLGTVVSKMATKEMVDDLIENLAVMVADNFLVYDGKFAKLEAGQAKLEQGQSKLEKDVSELKTEVTEGFKEVRAEFKEFRAEIKTSFENFSGKPEAASITKQMSAVKKKLGFSPA